MDYIATAAAAIATAADVNAENEIPSVMATTSMRCVRTLRCFPSAVILAEASASEPVGFNAPPPPLPHRIVTLLYPAHRYGIVEFNVPLIGHFGDDNPEQ